MTKILPGIALDIDGVLIRGGIVLPNTRRALQKLFERRFPTIFLTNGGGMHERDKAADLSKKFGLSIRPEQVVLSHSPFRQIVSDPVHQKPGYTLVIGPDRVKEVAIEYGFKNPILPDDVLRYRPDIWPFRKNLSSSDVVPDLSNTPINSVLIFHDSRDWGRDVQIVCDVLRSDKGLLGTLQPFHHTPHYIPSVPIYFSNPDFLWANEFSVSRFGQGAFRMCLERVYRALTGHSLPVAGAFGKPFTRTYQYAEEVINSLDTSSGKPLKRPVYAVGDNLASDIMGANNYGWKSILVRTGVYKEDVDDNSENRGKFQLPDEFLETLKGETSVSAEFFRRTEPHMICDDIGEAVEHILREEEMP